MNTFSILGDIVADETQRWYGSDVAPKQVIDWLSHQSGDVEITINSLGGSVVGGLAIANALRAYNRGKTTANVLGVAASMASVIACAADEIKMGKGAFLMIHNPWSIAMGDADELRKEAATLDAIKASIVAHYQTKFSKTAEEIAQMMDAETWIAIESAAEYGLAATEYEPQTGDGYRAAAKLDSRLNYLNVPAGALAHIAKMGLQKPTHAGEVLQPHAEYAVPEAPAAEGAQEAAEAPATPAAETPAEEPATPQEAADAPQSEATPDAPAEEPQNAAEANAAQNCDWEARYKGLQAAKDKELAALRKELADAQNALATAAETARAESAATIEQLTSDNAKLAEDLAKANAACKQLQTKCADTEKELANAQSALKASEDRYCEHIGLALAPPAAGGSDAAKNWRSAYNAMRHEQNSKKGK